MKKKLTTFFALFILAIGFIQAQNPKYVFLFIGDGMGVNQVYASELYMNAKAGEVKSDKLLFNEFPVISHMTTFAANTYVTGSAAAGTAMSTGFKTNNGIVGKSPDLQTDFETISVKAKRGGYKVGVLSSVMIDHATPASFYAHQESRNMYYEISMELPKYEIDYFGGGGFHYPKGENGDLPDVFENAKKFGYKIANSKTEIESLNSKSEKVIAINPQTYPLGEFHWAIDKKEGAMSLADFTRKGIDVLKNDKGFFMMVEGGKIDWACHGNDGATMIHEVLALNDAVKVAFDFYKENPDETLIIVTADHETGSMFTGINYSMSPELLKYQKISVQEFKRKMEELKTGDESVSFNKLLDIIKNDFGLGNEAVGLALTDEEKLILEKAYNKEFIEKESVNPDADYLEKSEIKSVAETAAYILNTKAGIGWGTSDHSSMPAPVRAIGVGQEQFAKYFDNTDLPRKIEKLMGIK